MPEDDAAGLRPFVERMLREREAADPLLREFAAVPAVGWDGWIAAHDAARSTAFFQGLLERAQEESAGALALTQFVLRHLDPNAGSDGDIGTLFLYGNSWRVQASALLAGGHRDEALHAYDTAAAIFRVEPLANEELAEVEREAAALRGAALDGIRGAAARLLASTPFLQWGALADRPELQSPGALADLSREASGRVHRVPLESLAITNLAVRIADRLPAGGLPAIALALVRGRAWKDAGVASRYVDQYRDALAAYARALQLLAPFPTLDHERAVVELARASTLQEMGRFDEAAAALVRCKRAFEKYGDQRRQMLCGIYEGTLLHRMKQYRQAIEIYTPLLERALNLGDLDSLASTHNNIGYSAIEISEYALAESHLQEAAAIFTKLDAPVHVARVELARGRMWLKKGDIERGMAHLHEVRSRFLQSGLVEEAGLAGLDVVEAYLSRGQASDAEALARQIVREFTSSQLNERAIKALGYLSEAIAARKASAATVDNVREFIHTLRTRPETEFAATA